MNKTPRTVPHLAYLFVVVQSIISAIKNYYSTVLSGEAILLSWITIHTSTTYTCCHSAMPYMVKLTMHYHL